ncbi:Chorismate mutase [Candidatus Methanobinarius endosymbioticus]|uniref:Chorismate mutase n=1 Tax=Candidatus Methanobinarius endosymbioticus TaxID=2006182 RepID=A0A366MFN2_9EURY|nr:Chorismate mutase [Candidatus Methanobinarius endosymbioticus]
MEHQLSTNEKSLKMNNPEKILEDSRKEIDRVDNELIDLIHKRTSLGNDIVTAKIALNMDIYDEKRENIIHEKTIKIANEKILNDDTKNSIIQIMNILTSLSKTEQKKIINKK